MIYVDWYYTLEKKLAADPSRFGKGAIEGVAGPEAANDAGAQTSFIPMLTLGIPPNAVMALMVGAMTIFGIVPGPQVISSHPTPPMRLGCGRRLKALRDVEVDLEDNRAVAAQLRVGWSF